MDDPRLLAIGDGVTTDVQGAVAEGIDVIFVTGGIAARNFGDDPENPDPALLEDWLANLELSATYGIGRLR
jgi:ribonucleotide monophosphatase NagD (HAD superfamily)